MKRFISILLISAFILPLCSCSGEAVTLTYIHDLFLKYNGNSDWF